MKKILVIIGGLRTGGAEKITVDLVKNMDRTNLDISFLVFDEKIETYEPVVKAIGCNVIHISQPTFPYLKYAQDLKKVWNTYGPFDAIHTHTLLNNGINCYLFRKMGCPKMISHSHTTDSNRKDGVITRIYQWLMKKMIQIYATDYLACGQAAGAYLYGEELFCQKGIVIPNGVDVEQMGFHPDVRQEYREKMGLEGSFVIGHVARLAEVKNHAFALKIVDQLRRTVPNVKYVIVGEGPEEKNISEAIIQRNLQDHVLMLGKRSDVQDLQNAFDMILFPSLYEGLPVALVEAQMNGLPCVISDNVSVEARLTENTKYLPLSLGAAGWAEEIQRYTNISRQDNPLLPEAKQFDIKVSAELLRSIYLG